MFFRRLNRCLLLLVALCTAHTFSFTHSVQPIRACNELSPSLSIRSSPLSASFFDDIQRFFDDLGSGGNDKQVEDDLPAGTCRIITIPVKSIKPGGLRLFLMFYLMGQQNTPGRNAWRAYQPSSDDYVIDFLYHDQTASLTVTLNEDKITIDRVGSMPSTSYVMQETVVIQGILEELHQCAFDETIDEPNRLLILKEPKDAIEKARDALAFG